MLDNFLGDSAGATTHAGRVGYNFLTVVKPPSMERLVVAKAILAAMLPIERLRIMTSECDEVKPPPSIDPRRSRREFAKLMPRPAPLPDVVVHAAR
jgi:hypothetical protein